MGRPQLRLHHGNLRDALIKAATEKLRDEELNEISLRELAKMVGVTTAAPYNHFDGKQDLFNAIASEGFSKLVKRLEDAVRRAGSGEGQIRAIVKAYLRFHREEPGHYKVMFQSTAGREHQEGSSFADQALDIVLAAIHLAIPGIAQQNARERAILLCSVLHGLLTLNHAGPFTRLSDEKAIERMALAASVRLMSASSSQAR